MPGNALLVLDVYPWERPEDGLPATQDGIPIEYLVLTKFKIAPIQPVEYSPSNFAEVTFGHDARLVGFEIAESIQAGQPLTVTLLWEALNPGAKDYTVFVHMLDEAGTNLAQADSPPQDGWYPTSIWAAGERIVDSHVIQTHEAMANIGARIEVGLYDTKTGVRLPATKPDGSSWVNDSVFLGYVNLID